MPTVSLDTVYRNLKLLAQHGLISIVGVSPERLRFDANMTPHHHFVCEQCGLIRDFTASGLEAIPLPEEAAAFGQGRFVHVEVWGACRECLSAAQDAGAK